MWARVFDIEMVRHASWAAGAWGVVVLVWWWRKVPYLCESVVRAQIVDGTG